MLVLSRKSGEAVSIGGFIVLKVLEIRGNRVKLGLDCPADVRVFRKEILESGDIGCAVESVREPVST